MRKSGAVDAEFGVFATEISRSSRIETYELRDLRMFIMVWNGCVERFMFMDVYSLFIDGSAPNLSNIWR